MTPRHFANAPILEALFDITLASLPVEALAAIKSMKLPPGYKQAGEIGLFTGEFQVVEEKPTASAAGGRIGYRFHSGDDKFVAQARINGFTFSRMAPYDRWETFINEARIVWRSYRDAIGATPAVQFSVRYINKLHIPAGAEMKVYLRTYPEVSPELPQILQGSFMRLEIPLESPETGLLILQQFYSPPDPNQPNMVAMILDNELRFQTKGSLSDDELWTRIDAARETKNHMFRGCLTPTMEEMID
jgi:uncharacterized protein (TIGR04255 family)